jgi:hypothetical protein
MRWKIWGAYAAKSNCGNYSVSRSLVQNVWVFEAWHKPEKEQQIIGRFDTSKQASNACVKHQKEKESGAYL